MKIQQKYSPCIPSNNQIKPILYLKTFEIIDVNNFKHKITSEHEDKMRNRIILHSFLSQMCLKKCNF